MVRRSVVGKKPEILTLGKGFGANLKRFLRKEVGEKGLPTDPYGKTTRHRNKKKRKEEKE